MNFMEEDSLPPDLAMIELLFMEEDRLPPDLASVGFHMLTASYWCTSYWRKRIGGRRSRFCEIQVFVNGDVDAG
jgi:hypothetical protein